MNVKELSYRIQEGIYLANLASAAGLKLTVEANRSGNSVGWNWRLFRDSVLKANLDTPGEVNLWLRGYTAAKS